MFISDKVSSMTKLQPNTVIRAALDLLNEVGVDGLTTRKLAERLGVQQPRFLCEAGFSAGDAVNALMTISYFTVGAVLEEQAGDSDAGERGGTVEQAPLSPLLRAAIDAFDEAGPDAAFEQGLAVIVDGLAKRRLVVRNVEGPRKGDD